MNQSSSSVPRPLRIAAQLLMAFALLLALIAPLAQAPIASQSAAAAGAPDPSVEPEPVELPPDSSEPPVDEQPSDALPSDEQPSDTAQPSDEEPSPESSLDATEATGTLTINLWECPGGYDPTDSSSNPAVDCTDSLPGIRFDLDQADPYSDLTQVTGEYDPGLPGSVVFGAVGPGTSVVTQYLPDGIVASFDIGCSSPSPTARDLQAVSVDEITVDIADGENRTCDWYDVPSGTVSNTITISKWLCPSGYDYTDPDSDPFTDCTQPLDGVAFDLAMTAPTSSTVTATTGDPDPGVARFSGFDPGTYELTEVASPGAADGFRVCNDFGFGNPGAEPAAVGAPFAFEVEAGHPFAGVCDWFNVPSGTSGSSITIYKWTCPYGYDSTMPGADPAADCTAVTNAVPFTLTPPDPAAPVDGVSGDDGPGTLVFDGLTPGTYGLQETFPPQTAAVIIECHDGDRDRSGTYQPYEESPVYQIEIPGGDAYHAVCNFYNVLTNDPGQVIIYKWTCPAGYDISAYGANAAKDCTKATNGVQFNAESSGYTSQTNTGDAMDGAVMFGGIEPGDYTFTETVPADTLYVFIADCTGTSVDAVHPHPLSVGNPLLVRVNPGDRIVCNWYNVPKLNEGTITVTKYSCSTPTFTSAVNCEIYEGGITFTLLRRDGASLTEVTDGRTDATGQLTWSGLPPGQYTVHEEGYAPCRITASQLDGGYVAVSDATTTSITVYNCTSTSSPQSSANPVVKPSNRPPGKFPDTGTGPNAVAGPVTPPNESGPSRSPAPTIASTDEPASSSPGASDASESGSPSGCPALSEPNVPAGPSPSGSSPASASPSADEQVVEEASLAPSPDAGVSTCDRGAIPVRIAVAAADIDAHIEVIETVDGQMQAPTGAEDASWYRETSRLGEEGPVVISGHLNYWNTPEGVFYALAQLQAGDTIEVTGEDGGTYRYEVRSTEQFPADTSPNELFASVDQSAGGETMVLITCGGEWDASVSEYNERTVVVATRVLADES